MANVVFRRGTSAQLAQIANVDGQLLFSTDENKILMDDGTTRKQYGGDTQVDSALSSTSTNPLQNKIVYSSCVKYTDIVDSLATIASITQNDIPVGALAVKELNSNLTNENNEPFRFGYDAQSGKRGYIIKEAGTDVFVPFSSKLIQHIWNTYMLGGGTNSFIYETSNYSNLKFTSRTLGNSAKIVIYGSNKEYTRPNPLALPSDAVLLKTISATSITTENINISNYNWVYVKVIDGSWYIDCDLEFE